MPGPRALILTLRLDAVRATAQQLQAKDPGLLVPAGGDTTEF
jgi:hypothetical protein